MKLRNVCAIVHILKNIKIKFDNQNNVYFGLFHNGTYVLKNGETTPTKIGGIDNINSFSLISIDSQNNVYFIANGEAYVLKQGETTAIKINEINTYVNTIAVNNNSNNIYFGTDNGLYVLKVGTITAIKIDDINGNIINSFIDKNNNIRNFF